MVDDYLAFGIWHLAFGIWHLVFRHVRLHGGTFMDRVIMVALNGEEINWW